MATRQVFAQNPKEIKDASDRVVVVAAQYGLDEYLRYAAYICLPNRAFRECTRMAFYANNKIDRRIPKILEQIQAISRDEIETRTDLSDAERATLRTLASKMETVKSKLWSSMKLKIVFLTPYDSPETLILAQDIDNDLSSENGRRAPFTRAQRYVSLSRLERGPKNTSELI